MAQPTIQSQQQVAALYISMLGRDPEPEGFAFWVNAMTNGRTQSQIASAMSSSPEFKPYLALVPADAVERMYENILGREATPADNIAFWTSGITGWQRAGLSYAEALGQIAVGITNAAFGMPSTTRDGAYVQAEVAQAIQTGTATPTTTFTLTTGIDTFTGTLGNDVFNAELALNPSTGLPANQTLNPLDRLDGAGGVNTLNAQINTTVTPIVLSNIQIVNASMTANTPTLGLVNAAQLTTLSDIGSVVSSIYTGLAAGAVNLNVADTTEANKSTTFTYTTTTGAQSVNLGVSNLTVFDAATDNRVISLAGIETINVTSAGNASGYELVADSATTLNFAGASAQTVTMSADTDNVTSFNAAATSGGINLTVVEQAGVTGTTNVSVTGGSGNDTLVLTAQTKNDNSVSGGAGNDTFTFGANLTANTATASTNDTIVGGDGFDTVSATTAALAAINNTVSGAVQSISGIEAITVSNALEDSLVLSRIQAGIQQVNLGDATDATARSVTFDSGVAGTVRITAGDLGNTLTVVSAGSGTADQISLVNATAATDVFDGKALVATGVETLTLNGSTTTTRATQDIGTIGATSGTTAVVFTGNNAFATAAITAGTVNASGLTGTAALTLGAATVGVTSITGSANADTLVGSATATTIDGGAGNDTITGGVAADVIDGGAGADIINGAGGNDVIRGGEGNDTITVNVAGSVNIDGGAGNDTIDVTNTLNTGDVVNGGEGVNTLAMSAALIADFAGVTNFQTLQLSAAMTQNAARFTGTTLTRVNAITGDNTVTNASALLNSVYAADAVGTVTFARATNTASDTLTIGSVGTADGDDDYAFAIIANNEDTLNFVAGATTATNINTITLSGAVDVDTINISGIANQSITVAATTSDVTGFGNSTAQATRTITVNASSSEGTVVFNGANATAGQSLVINGVSTLASTLTGGLGADIITGGSAADSLVGGAGNDVISGGAGNDTIAGGTGSDSINVGTGTDRVIYSGAVAETQQGVVATGFVFTGDTISALGNGDVISLAGVDNLVLANGAISVGTTFATATANQVVMVSGSFDTLTGIFTAGAASTSNNDYLLQFNGANTTTTVNSVMMVDIVGTVTAASASELITLTVA